MSSYIPTTTVAVTRARDALSYPVASVTGFDTTQGSLAAEFVYNGQVASGFGSVVALVGANANTDHINVYVQQSNASVNNLVKTAGASVANTGSFPNSVVTGALSKAAVAYTAASLSGAINAVLNPAGGAPGTLPTITNLSVMQNQVNFQSPTSGWFRRVRYWPRQLSQAELISVTS